MIIYFYEGLMVLVFLDYIDKGGCKKYFYKYIGKYFESKNNEIFFYLIIVYC